MPIWDEYEPELMLMPILYDTVNFENPAEIEGSINTLFNGITLPQYFGDKTEFWRYLENKYGDHRVLWRYTVQYPTPVYRVRRYNPDNVRINGALKSVFIANDAKYQRLIKAMEEIYNPLEPYNIREEHAEGSASSKTTMNFGEQTTSNKETSNDSLTSKLANEVIADSYDNTVDRDHDQSVTFETETLGNTFDEISRRKDRRVGNIGNHAYAELIEKEIELARLNLWDIVSKDICDMICYKLFMSC